MFDLNDVLHEWRGRLRQEGRCRQDDIDELEEHLREEMTRLAQAGLSKEEAFLLASRRLGSVDVLGEEFRKVNAPNVWLNRLRWMGAGVVVYLAATVAMKGIWGFVGVGVLAAGFPPYVAGTISPLLGVGVVVLAFLWIIKALLCGKLTVHVTSPRTLAARFGVLFGVLLWFTLLTFGSMWATYFTYNHLSPFDLDGMDIAWAVGKSAHSAIVPLIIIGWIMRTPRRAETA